MSAPQTYTDLRNQMVEQRSDLPRRLAQIADHVIRHPDDVAFGTAASVADSAGVQPSALIRFAKTFGYQGFSDLQSVFRDRLRSPASNYGDRLAAIRSEAGESRHGKVFVGILEAAQRSVAVATEQLDIAEMERAVGLLAAADTIYLIGRRRAFPVVAAAAYTLATLAVPSLLVQSAEGLEPEIISRAGPSDAVLAVSFAPYSAETETLVDLAAKNATPVVAITDSPLSPLAAVAAATIEIAEADYNRFRSNSAALALATALAVAVGEARPIGNS